MDNRLIVQFSCKILHFLYRNRLKFARCSFSFYIKKKRVRFYYYCHYYYRLVANLSKRMILPAIFETRRERAYNLPELERIVP